MKDARWSHTLDAGRGLRIEFALIWAGADSALLACGAGAPQAVGRDATGWHASTLDVSFTAQSPRRGVKFTPPSPPPRTEPGPKKNGPAVRRGHLSCGDARRCTRPKLAAPPRSIS